MAITEVWIDFSFWLRQKVSDILFAKLMEKISIYGLFCLDIAAYSYFVYLSQHMDFATKI